MNALTMLNDVNDLFEHALEHGWSFAMVRYPHFTASPNPALVTTEEDGNMWAAGWGEIPGDDRTRHMVIDAEAVSPYVPGDRVFHQKFGYGTVAAVEGDKLAIDFEKAGRKNVVARFVTAADEVPF